MLRRGMSARILIGGDAPYLRVLKAWLAAQYFEVTTATDGFEVLRRSLQLQPDLVMLDTATPGLDAIACCRRLKQDAGTLHIPVVLVTARDEIAERVCAIEAGADDFLSRRVDPATLLARVRSLVRLRRLLDEWRARFDTARAMGLVGTTDAPPTIDGARVLV